MPRTSRLIVINEKAGYHVMSRTALDGFPLKDIEKDFMLDLIKRFSALYFTEILGFCLMGNHFHLLVKMIPEHRFTDGQIKKRFEAFYGDSREFTERQIPYWRETKCEMSKWGRTMVKAYQIMIYSKNNPVFEA